MSNTFEQVDQLILEMGHIIRILDIEGSYSEYWTNDATDQGPEYVPALIDITYDMPISEHAVEVVLDVATELLEPGEEFDNPEYVRALADAIVLVNDRLDLEPLSREIVLGRLQRTVDIGLAMARNKLPVWRRALIRLLGRTDLVCSKCGKFYSKRDFRSMGHGRACPDNHEGFAYRAVAGSRLRHDFTQEDLSGF